MKKLLFLLIAACILLAACGGPDASETVAVPTLSETEIPTECLTEAPTEAPAQSPAPAVVAPLPATLDLANLDNCTVAVSLGEGCAWFGNGVSGIQTLNVTVYTYDLYDMVDISMLKGGDIILIRGEEVVIEALERTDNSILINGGLDLGGYELRTDEYTVYYEIGYSDMKYWQELGIYAGEAAESFIFIDASDPDREPVNRTFEDLVKAVDTVNPGFEPQNTTVTIEDGYIVSLEHIYTP